MYQDLGGPRRQVSVVPGDDRAGSRIDPEAAGCPAQDEAVVVPSGVAVVPVDRVSEGSPAAEAQADLRAVVVDPALNVP